MLFVTHSTSVDYISDEILSIYYEHVHVGGEGTSLYSLKPDQF